MLHPAITGMKIREVLNKWLEDHNKYMIGDVVYDLCDVLIDLTRFNLETLSQPEITLDKVTEVMNSFNKKLGDNNFKESDLYYLTRKFFEVLTRKESDDG